MLLLGDNFSLIRAHSLSSRVFKVTVHFIQGLSGSVSLSGPNSSKKSIAKLEHRRIFVYIADTSTCSKSFPFSVAPEENRTEITEILGIKFNIFSRSVSLSIGFIMNKCPANHHPTPPSAFTWRKLTPPKRVTWHS